MLRLDQRQALVDEASRSVVSTEPLSAEDNRKRLGRPRRQS